jgi:UDP-2-acetamido-3-amino-2,3-dideoxy-glucuronate N-acetyltransferase
MTTPKVALVGCGRWGRNLGRCLARLGALDSVCDASPDAAAALASEHTVPVRSLDDLLADDTLSGMVVATPAVTHAQVTERCLSAGKHVFVEKPMAVNVADAEANRDLAERVGVTLMVGHLLQYHAGFITLRQLVEDGAIGRLRYVYSNRLAFGQIRSEENSLWSFGPHDISMILSLMSDLPSTISAVGAAFLQPAVADVTTTHLTFPEQRHAHVFVSWLHPYKEQKLVVVGESGMLEFNDQRDWAEKVLHYPHQVEWRGDMPTARSADVEAVPVEPSEPLMDEMRHFLECISCGRRPRTDAEEGIAVLRVLNEAQRALDLSSPPHAPAPLA